MSTVASHMTFLEKFNTPSPSQNSPRARAIFYLLSSVHAGLDEGQSVDPLIPDLKMIDPLIAMDRTQEITEFQPAYDRLITYVQCVSCNPDNRIFNQDELQNMLLIAQNAMGDLRRTYYQRFDHTIRVVE